MSLPISCDSRFAPGLELFGFGERSAALGVELAEGLDVEGEAAIRQSQGDRVEILAEEGEIVHASVVCRI